MDEKILKWLERESERVAKMARSEVREELKKLGCDPEHLRDRLHLIATVLADVQKLKGHPVPEYLEQVIKETEEPHDGQ